MDTSIIHRFAPIFFSKQAVYDNSHAAKRSICIICRLLAASLFKPYVPAAMLTRNACAQIT